MMAAHATIQQTTDRLFYEWWMLAEAEARLAGAPLDPPTRNAWIESGAVHARNLKAFFYRVQSNRTPEDDDVSAENLVPQHDWPGSRPPAPSALNRREFGNAANKQIAHFTNTSDSKKDWDFSAVADALQPAVEYFFTILPPGDLGERWRTQLADKGGPRWDKLREILRERSNG